MAILTSRLPIDKRREAEMSLFQLLKPEVVANPYPFYERLRKEEPVRWDPFLHSWVVTSYAECALAMTKYNVARTPTPEYLVSMGLEVLAPYAELMLKQILFMDAPGHIRLRAVCANAFTPRRIEVLREQAHAMAHALIDAVMERGEMDLIADYAAPFPTQVLTAMIGLPIEDCARIKQWASGIAELIGNFEHSADRVGPLMANMREMQAYLHAQVAAQRVSPREGVISVLLKSDVAGEPLNDDEIVSNVILMISGGLEEPCNLIGCGTFSLLQQRPLWDQLCANPQILPAAVEELLRYESPTQQTGRVAPEDTELGGQIIRKGDVVTIVVGAANRDPLRFFEPDKINLERSDNRHLAFGWASHYCIGAPLARLTGQVALGVLTQRLPDLELETTTPEWRRMASLRGIIALPVRFSRELARSARA